MDDKYDEKAFKICPRHRREGQGRVGFRCNCAELAAFGRECAAEAFEEAADRCQTRATDAKLAKMRVVVSNELESRKVFFLMRAAALRTPAVKNEEE